MPIVSFNARTINSVYDNTVTLLARITAARAGYLDYLVNINNAQLLNVPNLSAFTPTVQGRIDTTISSRAAASTALSNATWTDARAGYQDYINHVLPFQYTTNVHSVYPTNASAITVTSNATAWTKGNWIEVVPASTITSNFIIDEVHVWVSNVSVDYEYDIGFGGAGSEVVKFTGLVATPAIGSVTANCTLKTPHKITIPVYAAANSRVAFRCSDSSGGKTISVKIGYYLLALA